MRKAEREDQVLFFYDAIQEKPYTDENERKYWYYNHGKDRAVEGFSLLMCMYHVDDIFIPEALEVNKEPVEYYDLKTRKRKRASLVIIKELTREMSEVLKRSEFYHHIGSSFDK